MWDCVVCGCKAIVHDLGFCPMCSKENPMPKVTSGGSSNNWGGVTPDPDVEVEPVVEPEPEPAPNDSPEPAQSPEPEPVSGSGGITIKAPGAANN